MILTTWNVNGIRAAVRNGLLGFIDTHAPDVLCLQEIKARPEQLGADTRHALESAYPYAMWNSANQAGYSGVATLARHAPLESHLGLGDEAFDQEGRLIATRYPDFWLFNLYFPHGRHDYSRVPFKLNFYARLLELCDRMHAAGEKLVLSGDFNTCHRPIDLRHPKANEKTSGFLPEERVWIDYYIEHGLVDIYRKLYPERVQYTWWTYRMNARHRNVGWRLDYFMISESLVGQVEDVIIHEEAPGSDHCPVSLKIR